MPETFLCRLEYLTPEGWAVGHHGVGLLDPGAYVVRLRKNGKFGRATVLDDRLQPTSEVYVSADLPNLADLRPSSTRIPAIPPGLSQEDLDLL